MRPALLIVGAVLLFLGHLEVVHDAYREGYMDAIIYEKKSPTKKAGPEDIKEVKETYI
jgi:hypothetical protein